MLADALLIDNCITVLGANLAISDANLDMLAELISQDTADFGLMKG